MSADSAARLFHTWLGSRSSPSCASHRNQSTMDSRGTSAQAGEKGERRHTCATAVLVRAPIDDQGFDRLQVSVPDGREHPRAVLRDDVPGNLEGRLAGQRQPSDDVGIGARLAPLGEQVQRVGEEPRLFWRRTRWIREAAIDRVQERLDEHRSMTVSRFQRGAGRCGWVGQQLREDLGRRHRGNRWRHGFVREPVDARPERAARTGSAHWIVNSLLMRATDDAVVGDGVLRTLLMHEARNVGGNRRVMRTSTACVVQVRTADGARRPGRVITATTSLVASVASGP